MSAKKSRFDLLDNVEKNISDYEIELDNILFSKTTHFAKEKNITNECNKEKQEKPKNEIGEKSPEKEENDAAKTEESFRLKKKAVEKLGKVDPRLTSQRSIFFSKNNLSSRKSSIVFNNFSNSRRASSIFSSSSNFFSGDSFSSEVLKAKLSSFNNDLVNKIENSAVSDEAKLKVQEEIPFPITQKKEKKELNIMLNKDVFGAYNYKVKDNDFRYFPNLIQKLNLNKRNNVINNKNKFNIEEENVSELDQIVEITFFPNPSIKYSNLEKDIKMEGKRIESECEKLHDTIFSKNFEIKKTLNECEFIREEIKNLQRYNELLEAKINNFVLENVNLCQTKIQRDLQKERAPSPQKNLLPGYSNSVILSQSNINSTFSLNKTKNQFILEKILSLAQNFSKELFSLAMFEMQKIEKEFAKDSELVATFEKNKKKKFRNRFSLQQSHLTDGSRSTINFYSKDILSSKSSLGNHTRENSLSFHSNSINLSQRSLSNSPTSPCQSIPNSAYHLSATSPIALNNYSVSNSSYHNSTYSNYSQNFNNSPYLPDYPNGEFVGRNENYYESEEQLELRKKNENWVKANKKIVPLIRFFHATEK
ncbi:hypothetical protein HK099_007593 [Clydaea vesicula]|uniref:Uncharacterized protein n=1 Tax=Clydaea vesicula TaxID=447962 RepID=A0AAD5U5D5_9FUNG|nr:hypothetical protein HK099_007593 [Clydaea vesicula]